VLNRARLPLIRLCGIGLCCLGISSARCSGDDGPAGLDRGKLPTKYPDLPSSPPPGHDIGTPWHPPPDRSPPSDPDQAPSEVCPASAGACAGKKPGETCGNGRCAKNSGGCECCTGCIDETGACRDGKADVACGKGGESCRKCGGANYCESFYRVCKCHSLYIGADMVCWDRDVGSQCNIGSAFGTCDSNCICCRFDSCVKPSTYQCVVGSSNTACGSDGNICVDCPATYGPSSTCVGFKCDK
jgi:hypothetical protein